MEHWMPIVTNPHWINLKMLLIVYNLLYTIFIWGVCRVQFVLLHSLLPWFGVCPINQANHKDMEYLSHVIFWHAASGRILYLQTLHSKELCTGRTQQKDLSQFILYSRTEQKKCQWISAWVESQLWFALISLDYSPWELNIRKMLKWGECECLLNNLITRPIIILVIMKAYW